MAMQFSTENQTFRKIMGSGLSYSVPRYQRDYTWSEEQWDDLWADLRLALDEDDAHYMGYLVLQTENNRTFQIIDGQQRLTTVSILILSALKRIQELIDQDVDKANNIKRLETLKTTFIGHTDTVTLETVPKITLNRNNDSHYKAKICDLKEAVFARESSSNKKLSKCLSFFSRKISEANLSDGAEVAKYVEQVIDTLLFTTIIVGSDLNAYKVFETLNARGVKLSVPDLVKNYLFSVIDSKEKITESRLSTLEQKWDAISTNLGSIEFSKFLHAEWNSRNTIISKSGLFKRIKASYSEKSKAFGYLRQLLNSSEVYAALHNHKHELWTDEELKPTSKALETLSLLNITQPYGLLTVCYDKYEKVKFARIAGYLEAISIRYNFFGSKPANVQEALYNSISRDVYSEKITNLNDLKNALREIYIDDDEFVPLFNSRHIKTLQSTKRARFLLARLEEEQSGISINHDEMTLEHVLPQNPTQEWIGYFGQDIYQDHIDRLGNLALLPRAENHALARKSFDQKRDTLATIGLELTSMVGDAEQWNGDAVMRRQAHLADLAKSRWKIEFD